MLRLSLDIAAGRATSYDVRRPDTVRRSSPLVIISAVLRAPLRVVDISALLRVSTTNQEGVQMSTASVGLQLGKSW